MYEFYVHIWLNARNRCNVSLENIHAHMLVDIFPFLCLYGNNFIFFFVNIKLCTEMNRYIYLEP